MILQEDYTLSNGVKIPKIGLGTWLVDDANVEQAVKDALELGYRHIDTAEAYGNERGVGQAVRDSGVARGNLFVTTKLAAEIKSYNEAVAAIDESLETLGFDYIDMMIIHSPKPWNEFHGDEHYFEGNREVWKALEEAYDAGKLRAIGVSNFEREDLDNILEVCTIYPMVNQILVHINNTPMDLIEYTQSKDILVEAYSPIAHGELMHNDIVKQVASKYGVSVPQLSIRYTLQLGLLPLPKTTNPAHMRNNADVDFEISDDDMNALKNIDSVMDYGQSSRFASFKSKSYKSM